MRKLMQRADVVAGQARQIYDACPQPQADQIVIKQQRLCVVERSLNVQVYGSSATYKYKLDKYACKGTVCIYAKDGQFEHVPGEHEGVPSCAYSSENQLCQICPYKLEVRLHFTASIQHCSAD